MDLVLSPEEWEILSRWADKVVMGGRWGDGRLVLGEEEHVLAQLAKRPAVWQISSLELRVLRYWIENLSLSTPLEKSLAEKISRLS